MDNRTATVAQALWGVGPESLQPIPSAWYPRRYSRRGELGWYYPAQIKLTDVPQEPGIVPICWGLRALSTQYLTVVLVFPTVGLACPMWEFNCREAKPLSELDQIRDYLPELIQTISRQGVRAISSLGTGGSEVLCDPVLSIVNLTSLTPLQKAAWVARTQAALREERP